jgi:molybdenum cofactor synthesis domain-containing protein
MRLPRVGILTVSDRSARGERADLSGPALVHRIQEQGWPIIHTAIVPDERNEIEKTLLAWVDSDELDVIFTTGGTGFAPRDITPEATAAVIHRQAPGIAEAIRAQSLKITPHAMLSRGLAGIRGGALIINLPGSPKAAVESLEVILPVLSHAVDLLRSDPQAEAGHRAA